MLVRRPKLHWQLQPGQHGGKRLVSTTNAGQMSIDSEQGVSLTQQADQEWRVVQAADGWCSLTNFNTGQKLRVLLHVDFLKIHFFKVIEPLVAGVRAWGGFCQHVDLIR